MKQMLSNGAKLLATTVDDKRRRYYLGLHYTVKIHHADSQNHEGLVMTAACIYCSG